MTGLNAAIASAETLGNASYLRSGHGMAQDLLEHFPRECFRSSDIGKKVRYLEICREFSLVQHSHHRARLFWYKNATHALTVEP